MAKKKSKSFIGIDVSKQQLEVAVHESDCQFRCANKVNAFGKLIVELIDWRPALVVLEATGGLEIPVVSALHAAGLPVVVVHGLGHRTERGGRDSTEYQGASGSTAAAPSGVTRTAPMRRRRRPPG